jgi:hypothetical protein
MTSDAGIISHTSSSRYIPSHIVVGNGHLIPVTSTDTAHLPHNLSLNNVLVSPSLIKDLIFVRQFTTDNNCSVEFDPLGCSVKDLPTQREIIRCDISGPLLVAPFMHQLHLLRPCGTSVLGTLVTLSYPVYVGHFLE